MKVRPPLLSEHFHNAVRCVLPCNEEALRRTPRFPLTDEQLFETLVPVLVNFPEHLLEVLHCFGAFGFIHGYQLHPVDFFLLAYAGTFRAVGAHIREPFPCLFLQVYVKPVIS